MSAYVDGFGFKQQPRTSITHRDALTIAIECGDRVLRNVAFGVNDLDRGNA